MLKPEPKPSLPLPLLSSFPPSHFLNSDQECQPKEHPLPPVKIGFSDMPWMPLHSLFRTSKPPASAADLRHITVTCTQHTVHVGPEALSFCFLYPRF